MKFLNAMSGKIFFLWVQTCDEKICGKYVFELITTKMLVFKVQTALVITRNGA